MLAYLIGSISSTCIVGYLAGRFDMRNEPDGKISAVAIHKKMGFFPFVCVSLMDISLAILAVAIAGMLTGSPNIMMLAGIATVVGHNWSIFLKLKGGLGATAILGVLTAMITWQVIYGLIACAIIFLLTQKPGLSTILGIVTLSGTMSILNGIGTLALYPLVLFSLMLLKRFQVAWLPRPGRSSQTTSTRFT